MIPVTQYEEIMVNLKNNPNTYILYLDVLYNVLEYIQGHPELKQIDGVILQKYIYNCNQKLNIHSPHQLYNLWDTAENLTRYFPKLGTVVSRYYTNVQHPIFYTFHDIIKKMDQLDMIGKNEGTKVVYTTTGTNALKSESFTYDSANECWWFTFAKFTFLIVKR